MIIQVRPLILLTIILLTSLTARAQGDLFDLLGDEPVGRDYAYATFKTTRVVNSHSVENPAPGVLLFIISHHFGEVNSGPYELFGLDQSTIRLGFEYGINDRLCVGVGRSSLEKTYDGFIKYKLTRQQTGLQNIPLSVTYFASTAMNGLRWAEPERENYFSSRMSYVHQLLIARKFNNAFSLQIMPSIIHKNLVPTEADKNTAFAMGIGGRLKLSNRSSINGEYYVVPKNQYSTSIHNSLSIGLDVETGGHVFQLHFTNSKAMFERGFITETRGRWDKGDVYFGFNITRVFTIRKPSAFKN